MRGTKKWIGLVVMALAMVLGQGCAAEAEDGEASSSADAVAAATTLSGRASAAVAVALDGDAELESESLSASYMSRFTSGRGTCDVLSNGAKVATGLTAVLGVTTAACAEKAGVLALATGGLAAEGMAVCLIPAAGAAAAGLTALAMNVSYTLSCTDFGDMTLRAVQRAGAKMKEIVWEGVEYTLACSEYFYDKMTSYKSKYCKRLPSKCTSQMSCATLGAHLSNAHYCKAARLELWRCWQAANMDPEHWNEIVKATTNIKTCYGLLQTKCG